MESSSKLSIIAQYDDLVRFVEQIISEDPFEDKIKLLLQNFNEQRLKWLIQVQELNQSRDEIKKLKEENKRLETTLKNVRAAFKKELDSRERIQSERDLFLKKLNQVQDYLQDDSLKDVQQSIKETILSSLNLHKLTTVMEENSNEGSTVTLSDVEFDKTDEDVIDNQMDIDQQIDKINNTYCQHNEKQNACGNVGSGVVFENEEKFDDFSMLNDTFSSPIKDNLTPTQQAAIKKTPSTLSRASVNSRRSALSESIMKQRKSNQPEELNVENRLHQFVTKKVFRSEKCGPCGQSINFMTSCYHCRDCRAICHMSCKDQVPLPCIPYISRANIGKQGKLILISDYIKPNCKPCVPALIVHCISEIEKRGLNQIGIYRVPGLETEVKNLKEKILKSKHGMPSLSTVDLHVLCNVVKKFLLQLDEALIIRIAWRDFVEIANIKDEINRRSRFKEAILNLPNANRDTLAFLMLHLRRIVEHTENKMNISNLAKVFGPTVLGYSIRDPSGGQIKAEIQKQIQLVEHLLNLDNEFWQSILNPDNNNQLLNYSTTESMAGNVSLLNHHITPERNKAGRPSIGSRLVGGTVSSGKITPLKKPSRNFKLMPLF